MRQHKQNLNENALSILTLDDDPIMTATVQAYFQRSGYRVDVENDPHRAIERVRQNHYDIMLLDFLMSPICGDQVVEQIRQFNHDLYIILLTGHKSMAPPIKTIRALDIQGYYEKSDRFDQLELLVESCVKSIRQMRTIRSYKDGLSTIIASLPRIHTLDSMERITDRILHTAVSLLPSVNAVLTLDSAHYQLHAAPTGESRFISRAIGENHSVPTAQEAEDYLRALRDVSSLTRDKQLILPITDTADTTVGFIAMTLKEAAKYDQIQLMEIFAQQTSSAISNARFHALLQEQNTLLDQANSQLQSSYLEMIGIIRRVVDAKDTYTRGHSDRVSYYAYQIAQHMGHDRDFCERIRIAGLFHDVGKLSIPDEVLLKPGRLTDEEYQIIKTHPTKGEELLSAITQLRPILPIVRSHHERIDGRGYPDGLTGEAIPEEARIIAVADTFDAMTSDRQYRKTLGFRRAMDELERCKGTQLDERVVTAFQEMVRDQSFWDKMQRESLELSSGLNFPESAN